MRFCVPLAMLVSGALVASAAAAVDGAAEEREAFFETKIRPVLATTCFKCHGGKKTGNNLRVDRREALLKGGDSGPAIVAGNPEKSLLIRALRHRDDELKMPPDKKLPDAVVADFERWVRTGAAWPDRAEHSAASAFRQEQQPFGPEQHWAFQPVKKVEPPHDPSGWPANAVDCFIHAELAAHRLRPVAAASKRTLLRRAYFDLIGLPPTPKDVDAFLADKSPEAFANVVETLLASPQYGERWGRYWMDVVRYADTAGDNADYPVPEARLYRDYIIDAFNADKPYDQFVREQVAGDLLARRGPAEKYSERVVATGFLALSRRYATAPYELWHLTLEDTIDTVGRAYLGMTLRCARCHDHKFDPIPTRDYYALYGVFASTCFPYAGSEEFQSMKFGRRAFAPLVPPAAATPMMSAYQVKSSQLRREATGLESAKPRDKSKKARLAAVHARLLVLERRGTPDALPVAYAVSEGTIADANIQLKGEPSQPGEKVTRGVPRFLPGCDAAAPGPNESGRLELADWLASPRNPLTARVMVNRVWQHHFGRGIVATPSNFGTRGSPPSHPQLLDWLTASFIEHGWSIKSLHRLIMGSRTYQLACDRDAADEAIDSSNRWYWRCERQRLDAEAIRDAMLDVSGVLDLGRPGPHPFPPIREWHWTQHFPFQAEYPSLHRSVYLMTQRLHRHPFLGLFDGPDTNTTTDARSTSTVPLQALFLMNSDFMRETAGQFARRLCSESSDPSARIARAHELAYARPAGPDEIERGRAYVDDYAREAAKTGLNPQRADSEAWLSYARTILAANEFVYLD
jgi:cytochrome c553